MANWQRDSQGRLYDHDALRKKQAGGAANEPVTSRNAETGLASILAKRKPKPRPTPVSANEDDEPYSASLKKAKKRSLFG